MSPTVNQYMSAHTHARLRDLPFQSEHAGDLSTTDSLFDLIGRSADLKVVRVLFNQIERDINLFKRVYHFVSSLSHLLEVSTEGVVRLASERWSGLTSDAVGCVDKVGSFFLDSAFRESTIIVRHRPIMENALVGRTRTDIDQNIPPSLPSFARLISKCPGCVVSTTVHSNYKT